ncbi:MAG: 50S ribosomal protein L6 [Thiotrichaceae bacterium]|nr:50S ribosomal protein L6 [Thiotrichaceae bacterium]PCI13758.1 MAG: 50S ribosomal protein L6 [Thiotrichales bacterium]
MSRIAKNPVIVPANVEVTIDGQDLSFKGGKGQLTFSVHKDVEVVRDGDELRVATRAKGKSAIALSGTTRAIINNMVTGVHAGFEKKLALVGVGYRAQAKGKVLNLTLGFSHPVNFDVPEGITVETPSQTEIVVKGADKQQVGQAAANIRAYRPPEPYKGKGVRYVGEHIVMKEAKKK